MQLFALDGSILVLLVTLLFWILVLGVGADIILRRHTFVVDMKSI